MVRWRKRGKSRIAPEFWTTFYRYQFNHNQLPGMLEDFVAHLIPSDDNLRPKAEAILQEIEQLNLNRYTPIHHPKALIHTWLAWQETPGMPMGQAITAQVLSYNAEIANKFVEWLKRLFELADTSESR